jgi:hypothetical protein
MRCLERDLDEYRKQKNLKHIKKNNISLGVLSYSSNEDVSVYCTKDEIKCFDYYKTYDNKSYINGHLLK